MSPKEIPKDLEGQQRLDGARRDELNRPGLAQIDYRIATHASFLERMKQRMHRQEVVSELLAMVPPDPSATPSEQAAARLIRPLAEHRTRRLDDPAIAMLDAWATVADVLTFYQERIANENYLRTAEEHRSVTELARLVGYQPDPGVAASTRLAFRVDDSPQGPRVAEVPAGTQVQSLPEDGGLPQTFETAHALQARPEWNEIRPRLDRPQYRAVDEDALYMVDSDGTLRGAADSGNSSGDTTELKKLSELYFGGRDLPLLPLDKRPDHLGDKQVRVQKINVFYLDGLHQNLRRGDPILLVGTPLEGLGGAASGADSAGEKRLLRRLLSATPEPEHRRTLVQVEAFAPPEAAHTQPTAQATAWVAPHYLEAAPVAGALLGLNTGYRALSAYSSVQHKARRSKTVKRAASLPSAASQSGERRSPSRSDRGVFLFTRRVGFFGSNAPNHKAVSHAYEVNPFVADWDTNPYSIWQKYISSGVASRPSYGAGGAPKVYLERVVAEVEPGDWVVFSGDVVGGAGDSLAQRPKQCVYRVEAVDEQSISGFSLSMRATGLTLDAKGPAIGVRSSTAFVGNRKVLLAGVPMPETLGDIQDGAQIIEIGGTSLALEGIYPGLEPGQEVIVGGERLFPPGLKSFEVARLASVEHVGDDSILRFSHALSHAYRRDSVVVFANVVGATHGESRAEVLGSGDASQKNQSFILSQPPLTYIPAACASGSQSTLRIRVSGLLWYQVDSLLELWPKERGFVVNIDESAKTRVTFGDGVHGARLDSGRENIIAHYRSGIGLAGEVGEGRLTLLKRRPAGIREVTNPVAASGAADPESRDQTRKNAPRDTRLLERVVSLQDYADFARNYPGISKARAELISRAGRTAVHLTVGGSSAAGAEVDDGRIGDLTRSIRQVSSARYGVEVRSLESAYFGVAARLLIAPEYRAEEVLRAARARLEDAYGYEARTFAEPVSAAALTALIQAVDGVDAVFLTAFYPIKTGSAAEKTRERLLMPQPTRFKEEAGRFLAAQLLCIEANAIDLSED